MCRPFLRVGRKAAGTTLSRFGFHWRFSYVSGRTGRASREIASSRMPLAVRWNARFAVIHVISVSSSGSSPGGAARACFACGSSTVASVRASCMALARYSFASRVITTYYAVCTIRGFPRMVPGTVLELSKRMSEIERRRAASGRRIARAEPYGLMR